MFEETDLVSSLTPAVEQQMDSEQTPFVRETYARLVENEFSDEEAKKAIALCLADESNRMYIDKRDFDLQRYEELLDALPELPE